MRVRGLRVGVLSAGAAAALAAGFALACSETEIRKDATETAEVVRDNPPNAAKVYEETYDDERKKGEDRIEAAGDAYEAVLEVPAERAEKK